VVRGEKSPRWRAFFVASWQHQTRPV